MSPHESKYREAEWRYWLAEGVSPQEEWLDLPRARAMVRLQVTGSGPPLLFVHGGSSCGTNWAPMVAQLDDFHCLLLDRPGCGLSRRSPSGSDDAGAFDRYAADLLVDVLDALDLETVDVVATSLGGYFALRAAAARPDRFRRVVELGFPIGAPLGPIPPVMRLASLRGMGKMMARLPVSKRMVRTMLRQIGLKRAMAAGRLPPEGIEWFQALLNDTDTMRNEIDGSPPVISGLRGTNDAILLPAELLATITAPMLFLWGTDDPFGGEEVARRFVADIPDATLVMHPGAGHAVWVDDAKGTAIAVREFLAA